MLLISDIFKAQKDDLDFIIELGKELKIQDNLGTRKPLIFRISQLKEQRTSEELSDFFQLEIGDEIFREGEADKAKAKDYILYEYLDDVDPDICNEMELCETLWDIVEFCKRYEHIYYISYDIVYFSNEIEYTGEFLTRKAAIEHLEKFHHRYSNEAKIYCDCAAENEEITKLTEVIERIYEMNKGCDEDIE